MPPPSAEAFTLDLAGFRTCISVARRELEGLHLPLLAELGSRLKRSDRIIVLLAGPPGSGKMTLAALWEELGRSVPVQALPMDGFHLPNVELDTRTTVWDGVTVPLRRIKGSLETFDLPALLTDLGGLRRGEVLKWPRYDRTLHDPVPGALEVGERGALIVEGNYLLLDEPGWRDLRSFRGPEHLRRVPRARSTREGHRALPAWRPVGRGCSETLPEERPAQSRVGRAEPTPCRHCPARRVRSEPAKGGGALVCRQRVARSPRDRLSRVNRPAATTRRRAQEDLRPALAL